MKEEPRNTKEITEKSKINIANINSKILIIEVPI